ncbi:MAG: hypothetical protein WC722_11470 [Rhodospirillales bacterium]|jgi:hypothetical protein
MDFTAAIDAVFDSDLAVDAAYTPASTGVTQTIRALVKQADREVSWQSARLMAPNALTLEIKVGDVADPVEGDLIEIGAERRLVQGEPMKDSTRLVWTLNTRPDL